jgi:hypothetical protein
MSKGIEALSVVVNTRRTAIAHAPVDEHVLDTVERLTCNSVACDVMFTAPRV